MAGLTDSTPPASVPSPHPPPQYEPWTAAQSRGQFAALAKLRWHIFRNAFRRKGGGGELAARILFFPIVGLFAIGPIVTSGYTAYLFTRDERFVAFHLLTWAVFALWLLVLLNISPPALSFDISTIIRFPLSFPRYLAARLVFGILSAANVIGGLCLVAADIGIGIARPALLPWATLLFGAFALTNIFFTRMMMVWVERWLSTRRSREVFTAFILFASLGFQYINLNYNPGFNHARHHATTLPFLAKVFHQVRPIAAFLPPGLTAASIASFSEGHIVASIAAFLGLIAFAALFFAVYAWRMHREFLGENLSEVTQPNQPATHKTTASIQPTIAPPLNVSSRPAPTFGLNPTVLACLQKEFLYLRRNINQLYGFIAPVFMVFIFANRISGSGTFGNYVFPTAVAYSVLGVSILSYNALGMDGAGVQFYFISPTRLRDVFLAKNITGFLLNFVELALIFAVVSFVAHPPTLVIGLATVCWLLFSTFVNGSIGNLRSLSAPKKIDLLKATRGQASQLSVLISMGILLATAGIGFATVLLANYLGRPWLMLPILLALAVGAFAFYLSVLNRIDSIALNHRETLAEELCKA